MSHKEKLINQLRKGYSPIETGPKEKLNSIFKSAFKPRVDKQDLEFFFELFETKEATLRAWAFLGIYLVLKSKNYIEDEMKLRFHQLILDLLNDTNEVKYFGGSTEIRTSLREHHVRRISDLDHSLILEPIFEYVQSSKIKTDVVICDLLERVLSRTSDKKVESLILQNAKNTSQKDFGLKLLIIKAFENLGQNIALKNKDSITEIFKAYLKDIEEDKTELEKNDERIRLEIINRKKKLYENIFKVAAVLELDLEEETLKFLEALNHPYSDLKHIAKKYKDNEEFKSILLKKLNESNNPHFIKDVLIAILLLKEKIRNWKDLILENLSKFQIIEGDLIQEIQKTDLYSEEMLINLLNEGKKWHLKFIREFFKINPKKMEIWSKFRIQFINILKFFKPPEDDRNIYPNFKDKKELVLKLLIDLELKEMVEYCLDNFNNLEDSQLRKIALYAIIKFGNDELMFRLKEDLKNNSQSADFFKKFWRNMENREWKFFY